MIFTRLSRLTCLSLLAMALAACTSTEQALTITDTTGTENSTATQSTAVQQQPVNMTQVRKYKLHIAPIIGAPLELVTPLSHRIGAIAKTNLIPLTPQGDLTTVYSLKGYFSNLTEGKETTVLYVWDVVDKSGNRVHRLQGQEKISNGSIKGWDAVNAQLMEKIADSTMNEYFRWLSSIPS